MYNSERQHNKKWWLTLAKVHPTKHNKYNELLIVLRDIIYEGFASQSAMEKDYVCDANLIAGAKKCDASLTSAYHGFVCSKDQLGMCIDRGTLRTSKQLSLEC